MRKINIEQVEVGGYMYMKRNKGMVCRNIDK